MSNVEKIDTNKGPCSKAIGKMLRTSPIKLNDAIKSIRGKKCRGCFILFGVLKEKNF